MADSNKTPVASKDKGRNADGAENSGAGGSVFRLPKFFTNNSGDSAAKKAAAEGRSVRDVVLEMGVLPDGADLDALLDVRSMTEPGIPGA